MDILIPLGRNHSALGALVGLLLAAGCAGPRPSTPRALDAEAYRLLRERAATPEALHLRETVEGQTLRLHGLGGWNPPPSSHPVPFVSRRDSVRSAPLIGIRVNDLPLRALLDTGSGATLISYRAALKADVIPLRRSGDGDTPLITLTGRGLAGGFEQILALAQHVELGDGRAVRMPIHILGLHDGFHAMRMETLIGMDVMRQFARVTFDFPAGAVSFETSAARHTADGPKAVPQGLPMLGPPPLVFVEVEWPGAGTFPAVLDTGADFGLWLPGSLAAKLGVEPPPQRRAPTAMGLGVGSPTLSLYVGPRTFLLGGQYVKNADTFVSVARKDGPELPFALIGRQVLSRFRVVLDFENRRVRLEGGASAAP